MEVYMEYTATEIKDVLHEIMLDVGELDKQSDLSLPFKQLSMNSIVYLKAIVTIEKKYNIFFDDEYLVKDNDFTLDDLVNFILQMKNKG